MSSQRANCCCICAKTTGSACSMPPRVSSEKTTPKPKVSSGALRSHTVTSWDGSSCLTRAEKYRPPGPPPTTAIRMRRPPAPVPVSARVCRLRDGRQRCDRAGKGIPVSGRPRNARAVHRTPPKGPPCPSWPRSPTGSPPAPSRCVDLTAPLSAETPIIQLPPQFGQTAPLRAGGDQPVRRPRARPGTGTTSAPASTPAPTSTPRTTGSPARTATTSPRCRPRRLVAPAVVLDFSARGRPPTPTSCSRSSTSGPGRPSTAPLPGRRLAALPHRVGRAVARRRSEFLNADDAGPHTPGVSPECARWLAEEAPVIGLGVETVGTDAGAAHSFDPPFPCHSFLLGAGKYGLTQLQNLALLPPTGAVRDRRAAADRRRLRQPGPGARAGRATGDGVAERRRPGAGRPRASARPSASSAAATSTSTNALVAAGARFVAARHEGGAATMADAYARMSRAVGRAHRAPGVRADQRDDRHHRGGEEPHAAGRARAPRRPPPRSNFHIDQAALATAVGAVAERVHSAESAAPATSAARTGRPSSERRTVAAQPAARRAGAATGAGRSRRARRRPGAAARCRTPTRSRALADALAARERPVFVAGRGARAPRAPAALEALAERRRRAARDLGRRQRPVRAATRGRSDVSGGFASPLAAELIRGADLDRRLGLRAEHVDDAARHADRPGRDASCRSTSTRTRSARTGRSTSASSATSPRPRADGCSARWPAAAAGYRTPDVAGRDRGARSAGATCRSTT